MYSLKWMHVCFKPLRLGSHPIPLRFTAGVRHIPILHFRDESGPKFLPEFGPETNPKVHRTPAQFFRSRHGDVWTASLRARHTLLQCEFECGGNLHPIHTNVKPVLKWKVKIQLLVLKCNANTWWPNPYRYDHSSRDLKEKYGNLFYCRIAAFVTCRLLHWELGNQTPLITRFCSPCAH